MNNNRTNDDKIRSSQMNNHWIHDNGMNERINDEAWIKEVRRLMAEREVKAPDHLLAVVKRELAAKAQEEPEASPNQPVSSKKARLVPLRSYRWAAAAAIVVAIALPVTLLRRGGPGGRPTAELPHTTAELPHTTAELPHTTAESTHTMASSSPSASNSTMANSTMVPAASSVEPSVSSLASSSVSTSVSSSPYLASNAISTDTPLTPNNKEVSTTQEAPKTLSTPSTRQRKPLTPNTYSSDTYSTPTTQHPTPNKLTLTAYCGGIGSGSGNGSGMTQGILMSDASPYGISSIVMNSGATKNGLVAVDRKKMKAHHNQPIKVGVSVGYALTDRWAVNTGVTYSYLSSDFIADGEPKQTQKLHYVGIPLSASYSVLKGRKAEVYVTAGGEVEKLVKGTVSSENKLSSAKDEKIKENRPQFSAKAAVGGAYHFTPSLSVYAEPGVSYYFDNHSAVMNVYKDRPTSFSLNVGVRYTVK